MATLSQLDIDVRILLSKKAYVEMTNKYISQLRIGKKSACDLEERLWLMDIYISMLEDYTPCSSCPDPSSTQTADNDPCRFNCVSEEEIQRISDKLSQLGGIVFQPIGFQYQGALPVQGGIGSMQIGCNFIVSPSIVSPSIGGIGQMQIGNNFIVT